MILRIRLRLGFPKARPNLQSFTADLVCLKCQGVIKPDHMFCPHCRAVIVRRYCPGCSRLVPDHTSSCPYCDTLATEKPKSGLLQYPKNLAAIILFLLFGALLLFWSDQKPEKEPQIASKDSGKMARTSASSSHQQVAPARQRQKLQPEIPLEVNSGKSVTVGARLNLRGHALIKQGRYQEAVSLLRRAVDSFPEGTMIVDYIFAQYNLAHSLRKIGKSEEAILYLQRCVAYDSRNKMFQRELQAARGDLERKNNY